MRRKRRKNRKERKKKRKGRGIAAAAVTGTEESKGGM